MSRKTIPESLKRAVLTESGFRCAVPTCRTILVIDLHHIIEVSVGGGDEFNNLIALCPNCHALYHRGIINKDSIKVWKGMLISLNGAFDKQTIDDLLFLHKNSDRRLELSGDGVLKFSKLIASNLAEYHIMVFLAQTQTTKYSVTLSEKGKLLVESWLNGDLFALEKNL